MSFDAFDDVPADRVYPERIRAMWAAFGQTDGQQCRTCRHYHEFYTDRRTCYYCDLNRHDGGSAADWRPSWPACGCWEKRL
jgi:hypothetical protein